MPNKVAEMKVTAGAGGGFARIVGSAETADVHGG